MISKMRYASITVTDINVDPSGNNFLLQQGGL